MNYLKKIILLIIIKIERFIVTKIDKKNQKDIFVQSVTHLILLLTQSLIYLKNNQLEKMKNVYFVVH
jgi:hypothetical protein